MLCSSYLCDGVSLTVQSHLRQHRCLTKRHDRRLPPPAGNTLAEDSNFSGQSLWSVKQKPGTIDLAADGVTGVQAFDGHTSPRIRKIPTSYHHNGRRGMGGHYSTCYS